MIKCNDCFTFRSDDMEGEEAARRPVSCDLEPRHATVLMQHLDEQTVWRLPADTTGWVDEFDVGKHDRTPCGKLTDCAEDELREVDIVTVRDRGQVGSIGRIHEVGEVRRGSWAERGDRRIDRRRQRPPDGTRV